MKREKNELLQMNKTVNIRNEVENDYKKVEEITRRAFWNLYVPGCIEHYLVHVMRSHEDFLPELDLVIEVDIKLLEISCTQKQDWLMSLGKKKKSLPSVLYVLCRNTKDWVTEKCL